MSFLKYILPLSLLLISISCLDQIDLDIEKEQIEGISINAHLVKGNPSFISVIVEPIFTFSANSRGFLAISEIYLQNEDGQRYDIEDRSASINEYKQNISDDFDINYKNSYQLVVQFSDDRAYESDFVQVLPSIPIDSLSYRSVQEERLSPITGNVEVLDFLQYSISTSIVQPDTNEKALLLWKVLQTKRLVGPRGERCYTTRFVDVNYVGVLDGSRFSTDTIINYPLVREFIQGESSTMSYITILQESISEAAYQYWNQVASVISQEGSLFDPAPGTITTNIRQIGGKEGDVHGLFYAAEQSQQRLRVCPSDLGLSSIPERCNGCDCKINTPPSYWEFCL